jgi:hypothetical protein
MTYLPGSYKPRSLVVAKDVGVLVLGRLDSDVPACCASLLRNLPVATVGDKFVLGCAGVDVQFVR